MSRTRIISLVNHKGGVGKITTTLNLSKAFNLMGKKVLLIDIDPQANLSQSIINKYKNI
jgi:chromosome partitioning protein